MSETKPSEFELLAAALKLPPSDRVAWLDEACGEDEALRTRLDELVEADAALAVPHTPLLERVRLAARELWERSDLELDGVRGLFDELGARPDAIKRYDVHEEIGHGGAGRVFRVWDRLLHRELAMKVLEAESREAPSSKALRFVREAHVTAQLEHPGIASVYDLGWKAEDELFFTMDLVGGKRLADLIDERGSLRRMVATLQRASEAAAYAHSRGVLHRDVSPRNILYDEFGAVFLVDWGLSRATGSLLGPELASDTDTEVDGYTLTGSVLGTLHYAPPEQVRGEARALAPTADVYSLGAVLYQVLAGEMPFAEARHEGSTVSDLRARIAQGPPRALEALAPHAPRDLIAVCERAMSQDPSERYSDASEFSDELLAWLEHREVSARHGGTIYRVTKWIRRRPELASLAVLSLVAIGVIAVAFAIRTSVQGRRILEEARVAKETTEFLEGLFSAATLYETSSDEVTLQSVLSEGARQADSAGLTPPVRLRLHASLGHALLALGDFREGGRLVRSALEEVATLDVEPELLARIRLDLGKVLHWEGETGAGRERMEQALELFRQTFGAEHPETIIALGVLARHMDMADAVERERIHRLALERATAAVGPDGLLALSLRHDLVGFLSKASRYDEALAEIAVLEQDSRDVLGRRHPHVLSVSTGHAGLLRQMGRVEEALEIYQDVRAFQAELFGVKSGVVAATDNDIAISLESLDRFEEAWEVQARLVEYAAREFGSDHVNTWTALNNKALTGTRLGRFEEADALLSQAHAGRLQHFGSAHQLVGQVFLNWGTNDALWGKAESAESKFRKALAAFDGHVGRENPDALATLRSLGIHLRNRGRFEEAKQFLVEGLTVSERIFQGGHPATLRLLELLGGVCEALGQVEESRAYRARREALADKGDNG